MIFYTVEYTSLEADETKMAVFETLKEANKFAERDCANSVVASEIKNRELIALYQKRIQETQTMLNIEHNHGEN